MFSFQGMNVESSNNQLVLTCGMGEWSDIPIPLLRMEGSTIELQVAGEEDSLERVLEAFTEFLIEIDGRKKFAERRLLASSVQTACVVNLGLDYEMFFSKQFLSFLEIQKATLAKGAQRPIHDLNLTNLSFQVRYEMSADQVPFFPRPLSIEPRAGSEPADRLFYIVAPLRSSDLKKVIEELEGLGVGKVRKALRG